MNWQRNGEKARVVWLAAALVFLLGVLTACAGAGDKPAAQEEAATEAPAVAEAAEATAEPAVEESSADAEAETAAESESEAATGLQTFTITSDASEARFYINEVLFGDDKTVEGVSTDVTGDIHLDPANPSASEIGLITINAREFATDADKRNGAIRKWVLQSDKDEYQYITFAPSGIEGMPDAVSVGEPFSFQVAGDLTIKDTTLPIIFEVEVTATSESELTGSASTTVQWADYGLTIPEVPMVTGVEDDVLLEFDFMAATG